MRNCQSKEAAAGCRSVALSRTDLVSAIEIVTEIRVIRNPILMSWVSLEISLPC